MRVMNLTVDSLVEQALELPTQARALLAEKLLHSLDPAEGPTLSAKWKSEVHRRLEEVSVGTSVPRDAGEAIDDALGSLT